VDQFEYLFNLVIALEVLGDKDFFIDFCFSDSKIIIAGFIDLVRAREPNDCETETELQIIGFIIFIDSESPLVQIWLKR
jgi:hypothetical protein